MTAHWTEAYLDIAIAGKSGSTWSITITNNSSTEVQVFYNEKMCNLSDAKNWTGLNDEEEFMLEAGQSMSVTISENWFATCIAVSYIAEDGRLITYANELNINGTLNIMINKI